MSRVTFEEHADSVPERRRRSLRDIANAIEPVLEVALLKTIEFDAELPSRAAAWLCLARKREVPAQPSTVYRPA